MAFQKRSSFFPLSRSVSSLFLFSRSFAFGREAAGRHGGSIDRDDGSDAGFCSGREAARRRRAVEIGFHFDRVELFMSESLSLLTSLHKLLQKLMASFLSLQKHSRLLSGDTADVATVIRNWWAFPAAACLSFTRRDWNVPNVPNVQGVSSRSFPGSSPQKVGFGACLELPVQKFEVLDDKDSCLGAILTTFSGLGPG